jgi:hypothetical protein
MAPPRRGVAAPMRYFRSRPPKIPAAAPTHPRRDSAVAMRLSDSPAASYNRKMSEPKKGLASLGLDNAIRLRWALRDIRGKRLKPTPVDPNDLRTLVDMGYVEIVDGNPVVTAAGLQQMEIGD